MGGSEVGGYIASYPGLLLTHFLVACKRGGKSGHGTSTHHQFFTAVETDNGGQFLSGADGLPGNVAVRIQPDALQPDSQPVSLQTLELHCSGAAGGGARGQGKVTHTCTSKGLYYTLNIPCNSILPYLCGSIII